MKRNETPLRLRGIARRLLCIAAALAAALSLVSVQGCKKKAPDTGTQTVEITGDTEPTSSPLNSPTVEPTVEPTVDPTAAPTPEPTATPAPSTPSGSGKKIYRSCYGRMGIPYRKEGISLISIAVDAPMDKINAITGKLGAIAGVSAKTVYPQKNC